MSSGQISQAGLQRTVKDTSVCTRATLALKNRNTGDPRRVTTGPTAAVFLRRILVFALRQELPWMRCLFSQSHFVNTPLQRGPCSGLFEIALQRTAVCKLAVRQGRSAAESNRSARVHVTGS